MAAKETNNLAAVSNFVIADASSSRKSIRSLLSDLGARPHQVHVSETFGDTKDLIANQKPEVLFVGQEVAGAKLDEIIAVQDQVLRPGSVRALFYITGNGTNIEASSAAEEWVDAVLVKPFTFEKLKEQVVAVLDKFSPLPHQQLINQGWSFFKSAQYNEAIKCFNKAIELEPKVTSAYYFMGQSLALLGKTDEARKAFERGLIQSPTNYRCLLGLIETLLNGKKYTDAYAFAKKLVENHPLPLKKIPDFVKLSILNNQFDDILEFYKVVDGLSSFDEGLSTNLSAGLVVCGLFYLKDGKTKDAIDIFKKAEVMARGNSKILTRMMVGLIKAGLDSDLNTFMTRMPAEVKDSIELRSAQLEALQASDPMLALKSALELINNHHLDPQIFRIAIQISFQLKRKPSSIQELIEQASRAFPDSRVEWEDFRSQLPSDD